MKFRIIFIFFASFLLNSCEGNLDEPTQLLTQVIKFYEDLGQEKLTAFAVGDPNSLDGSYIYFLPVEGVTNIQYFQTNTTQKIPTNFENYNVLDLELQDVYGGKLKRFVRLDRLESYSIITYQANGNFYMSDPIKLKYRSEPTVFTDVVTINQSQSLMPQFS